MACAAACAPPYQPSTPTAASVPSHIRVRIGGRIVRVPVEEYTAAAAIAEISPTGETAPTVTTLFLVQTILARTYAASHAGRHRAEGFDLCDTTHCQLYDPARLTTSRFGATAREAAHRTEGQVLTFGGRPADALFHADCGGSTAASSDVWGTPALAYLISVRDDVPGSTHRAWRFDAPADRLRAALNADPRSAVGRRLDDMRITARDAAGRVTLVELAGDSRRSLRAEALRATVTATFGVRSLLSTRFSVRRAGSSFVFEGTGFGHGVGLCQAGALARARRGDAAETILGAYFPGTEVRPPSRMPR